MKILVLAYFVTGESRDGGSSRFYKCAIDALRNQGHEVIASDDPNPYVNEKFDLIICSHWLREIRENPSPKLCISHGLIIDEKFYEGADRYISVSEEVKQKGLTVENIASEVIGQPINIRERKDPGSKLKKILVIRRLNVDFDPFAFLEEDYDLRYSDLDVPIEEQIEWADLCIALGRGALESFAQGKPVLVADNRSYMGGAYGDGYVNESNIYEISRCNFSGRRFKFTLTRDWIEGELKKYNPLDSHFLHDWVSDHHDVNKIVRMWLAPPPKFKVSFGVMCNDYHRLDMVFKQSELPGGANLVKMPESATKGLNQLLDVIEEKDHADIAVLCHQDMYFRNGWLDQLKSQIAKLPDDWIVAGIIGKDESGEFCGRIHDMRMPLHFATEHKFPVPATSFDECVIIVNMKSGFRFDEGLDGFHLYGTLCVLQAWEMGGTAWVIDAFAEHYCMRPFSWYPDKEFERCFKWLYERFPDARRIDSTVFMGERKKQEQVA